MFTQALLATASTTDHYGWHGGPGPWFLLFPLFWIAVFVTLGLVFGRRRRAFWRGQAERAAQAPQVNAESVLRDRFARGEIDAEEYQSRLSTLRES
ncbi:hypothetical protein Afil01_57340 [Actinorhabdospora filicis]|uniref:SHOCT domain-containing protein n=1 Tax=Actinorhabdospora filicis TaxID=1785913 RepID=A0A9W6SSB4_9ACTN|nr:SHOCT domain-containing protein [Actinorhabdospora filicis]GLZ80927.1 hypothetical protein Afil01_57340 [Actinorhabdospora filicis]